MDLRIFNRFFLASRPFFSCLRAGLRPNLRARSVCDIIRGLESGSTCPLVYNPRVVPVLNRMDYCIHNFDMMILYPGGCGADGNFSKRVPLTDFAKLDPGNVLYTGTISVPIFVKTR